MTRAFQMCDTFAGVTKMSLDFLLIRSFDFNALENNDSYLLCHNGRLGSENDSQVAVEK
jgi:hypothetical protein